MTSPPSVNSLVAVPPRTLSSPLPASTRQLREFPESGRVVPERGQIWQRELVRPPYRIVYRHANDLVEILTVFHSARMFPESLP